MNYAPRHELAALLAEQVAEVRSSAPVQVPIRDLRLEVEGIGLIRFPVSADQAAGLARLGCPARYGRGEETLTDSSVRDTWEVPAGAVHVDWGDSLDKVLEAAREGLGLAPDRGLTASFHSLLVYEPGQFFLPHQDSEKDDDMVATLVVMLPSDHSGGELVVHHSGGSVAYRGSRTTIRIVAFYADCRHEVRPVRSGHRIVLTYNLLLQGGSAGRSGVDDETVETVAGYLTRHFTQRRPRRYRPGDDDPAPRLVYLLDHEYTARGFDWSRLKGSDASSAALLRAGADRAGCDVVLALADLQETWDADDGTGYEYRRRSWGDEEYELGELLDSTIRLTRWMDLSGTWAEDIDLDVDDSEVCAGTPNAQLQPYASQYEGYMGNYGNTLDRWYRRAAVVVWPRERRFVNRAQASPAWALDEILALARAGEPGQARTAARTLVPFWERALLAGSQDRSGLLTTALLAAGALEDQELARSLLGPFGLEDLAHVHMPPLAALGAAYGEEWVAQLLQGWFGTPSWAGLPGSPDRGRWLTGLPGLSAALQAEGAAGTAVAHCLLRLAWKELMSSIGPRVASRIPSSRDQLAALGAPFAALLEAVAVTGASSLRDMVVTYCDRQEDITALVLPALRIVAGPASGSASGIRVDGGFTSLADCAAAQLRARLVRPVRADGDWSLDLPGGCTCELCDILHTFLQDPARRTFEWPLAQQRRQHVHSRIEQAELPVRHQTRRTGRPYTLVLTKTEELFTGQRSERAQDQADLDWLGREWLSR